MKQVYNKLVRDNIPEIIEAQGKKCTYRYLDKNSDEYLNILADKLVEEACEFKAAVNGDGNHLEELVDVSDVLDEIIHTIHDKHSDEFKKICVDKYVEKGLFEKGIILLEVSDE